MAGDEFVVLLPGPWGAADVARVVQKILALLAVPALIEAHEMSMTFSVGISLFSPPTGVTWTR